MFYHIEEICPSLIHSYLLVIDKGIHEQPLIDELLPLRLLISQVSVIIIGHNDAV